MTRQEAIQEALKMSDEVYADHSTHTDDDGELFDCYDMKVGLVWANSCKSWEECLEIIRSKDPSQAKKEKIDELKAELAKLEGRAA